ncbi:hypothetical protein [Pseudonocardia sp. WMMC193]|uniref:hypothetical protein n=1 Tax=Pseudonocardia sp. WMMC193 TaxID=2911965 RepID=UPI001F41AB63|nr:hypothetical protein [Pseudonocardia sp. WMMC193]MCF7547157.1 hypothetical protein [Pseudonocardia sp. WMMC193]MCF7547251.1 hypothetical protein [Pseudonocardia sp. WMMC193]
MTRMWRDEPPTSAAIRARCRRNRAARGRPDAPLADQTELRWRLRSDAAVLHQEHALGLDETDEREDLLHWLDDALGKLAVAHDLVELRLIATEWRSRRRKAFSDGWWADVTVVAPMRRPTPTWWWRLRHGQEPTPACSR